MQIFACLHCDTMVEKPETDVEGSSLTAENAKRAQGVEDTKMLER